MTCFTDLPAAVTVIRPSPSREIFPDHALVGEILAALSPIEIQILAGFYYDGQLQSEIGDAIGKTKARVGQIIAAARRKLATKFGIELASPMAMRTQAAAPKFVRCDPAALDQLMTRDGGDTRIARW